MSDLWKCPKCAAVPRKGSANLFRENLARGAIFSGTATCGGCGAQFSQSDVYGGKYDVATSVPPMMTSIREAHIWLEGSSETNLGAEIIRTLQPQSVQNSKLHLFMYKVESPFPSNNDLFTRAIVVFRMSGIDLSALINRGEVQVQEGTAHGRRFYALYLNEPT